MRKLFVLGVALAIAGSAYAAPNVTNNTQKGSLLLFPDIRVDDGYNTIIRLSNDGSLDVDVKCIWMDGNKHRTDFIVTLTKNQAIFFDARFGDGTTPVNPFPYTPSNGYGTIPALKNAFPLDPANPNGNYFKGLLACFAVDGGAMNQVKWNHLSGTATVVNPGLGAAYEYTAFAFYVPTGLDQDAVGVAGTINMNGVEYDSCPLYMLGTVHPSNTIVNDFAVLWNRFAIAGCTLNLNQDWTPVYTKLQFDVWNAYETKLTGGWDCADSYHETVLTDIDAARQNFMGEAIGTPTARFRVQGVKSTQCPGSVAVGIVAVHSSLLANQNGNALTGTNLTAAGKFSGRIIWDPEGAVPEGGIR